MTPDAMMKFSALKNVSQIYSKLGKRNEAIETLLQVWSIKYSLLSSSHPCSLLAVSLSPCCLSVSSCCLSVSSCCLSLLLSCFPSLLFSPSLLLYLYYFLVIVPLFLPSVLFIPASPYSVSFLHVPHLYISSPCLLSSIIPSFSSSLSISIFLFLPLQQIGRAHV